MKNKIISLTKVFLKNSFNSQKNNNLKSKKIIKLIAYILLIVYLGSIVGFFSFSQILALKVMGQEKTFLGLLFIGIGLFMLIQSIMSSINVLYFSKDVEFVLQLPISPKQIILSKMNVVIITEYFSELIIGLPSLIIYGILTNASFIYYIFAVIILICLPILPILLGSLLVMIIMSFTKFSKNKDKFQVITSMILVLIILAIQMFITNNASSDSEITNKIVSFSDTYSKIATYFVTLNPSINALTNPDILPALFSILQILVFTIISFIVFIEIGKLIYLRGATTSNSGTVKRKKKNENYYEKQNVSFSYVKKELKMLFRNPIFNMQCILPAILMPIIFIATVVIQIKNPEKGAELLNTLPQASLSSILIGLIAFNLFTSMITMISVTAVSRDGTNANFIKYIPIPLYNQFIYKIVPAFLMNLVTFIIIGIAFILIAGFEYLIILLPTLIITMLINIFINYFSEIIDLKHPKLEWNSEYEVVKQNTNMLYPFILTMIIIGIIIICGFIFSNVSIFILSVIMIVVFTIPNIIINKYVYKNQNKLFDKII